MPNSEHDNIDLKTAMTIGLSQSIRVWTIPGLQIKVENLPKDATIQETLVMMTSADKWIVGLKWTIEGHTGDYIASIAEFSSLQELFNNLPEFAELEGNLFDTC